MSTSSEKPHISPELAFTSGLDVLRGRPSLLVLKVLTGLCSSAVGATTLIMFLTVGMVALFKPIAFTPSLIVAFAGLLATSQALQAAFDSVAWSTIWGHVRSTLVGANRSSLARLVDDHFVEALQLRLFVGITNVFLILTWGLVGGFIIVAMLRMSVGVPVWGGAVFGGLALSLLAIFVILVRFTAEITAPAMVLEGRVLGDALVESARFVVQHPVSLYRVFIQAASALIPPLVVYYLAIFLQNAAMHSPALGPIAMFVRLAGEVLMLFGFAGFAVLTHYGFFMFWWGKKGGDLPEKSPSMFDRTWTKSPRTKVRLTDLLPKSYNNVVAISSLLERTPEPWTGPEDVSEEHQEAPKPYDFQSLLKNPSEKDEKHSDDG